MAIDAIEFKKRFGKKPIDEVAAEDRYKDCLKRYLPKIKAASGRDEKSAIDTLKELKALTAVKDWLGAADLLEEIAPKMAVNPKAAAALRKELADEVTRACRGGRPLATGLDGAQKAVETAVVEDDLDDARDQLDDFKQLVDHHLKRSEDLAAKTKMLAGRLKEVETRRMADGVKTPNNEEGQIKVALGTMSKDLITSDLAAAEKQSAEIERLLTTLLKEPADRSPDGLKSIYDRNLPAAKIAVDRWDAAADEPDWASLKGQITKVTADLEAAQDAYAGNDFDVAWGKLDSVVVALAQMDVAAKEIYDAKFAKLDYSACRDALRQNTIPVGDGTKTLDLDAMKKADAANFNATLKKNWVDAVAHMASAEADFMTLDAELKKQPVAVPVPTVAPKVVVSPEKIAAYELVLAGKPKQSALVTLMKSADFDAAAFRQAKGATKLLDDMVAGLGGKASNRAAREFVTEAMKCRFGLTEVTGGDKDKGLSTKALPRMYKLFAMLPASHTTDNEEITSLERQKTHDTSWHSPSEKKVVLKAGKSNQIGTEFDGTTLHEIAHGVDLKLKFMDTNGGARKFGGWRQESKASVLAVAGDQLGFYTQFKDRVPDDLMRQYLDVVLSGGNPKTLQDQFKDANDTAFADPAKLVDDPGVKHANISRMGVKDDSDQQRDLMFAARKMIAARTPGQKAILTAIVDLVAYNSTPAAAAKKVLASLKFEGTSPKKEDWDEMAVHPAVDFAANAGLKNGSNGLWDQGDAGAQRCAFGGRVYQESYAGDWRSYLLAARALRVSNYQFRHPMEWFAEVYAQYFLRKLKSSHPLYSWLQEQEKAKTTATS